MNQIVDFITSEQTAYQTVPITVVDGYEWNMWRHIKLTTLYKNSQLESGKNEGLVNEKPVKNIIRPILNLQYRSEGFDVKDIVIYVNDLKEYYKSFLVKKFHEKWARENHIDTFIDEVVETYVDYGGVLVKNVNEVRPEVVPWQRIAFCDQTDVLSGPIVEKHSYSPDQLKEMESKGWGSESHGATGTVDDVIRLAEHAKKDNQVTGKKNKTPGKYIEVYEVHGVFPSWWLEDEMPDDKDAKEKDYIRQIHIVTLYKDTNGNKQGITLFKGKEKTLPYKFLARDGVYGRALGMGGAEELFEPQVWINYDMIRMKDMLDAASKVILQYAGDLKGKTKLSNMDNLEVVETEDGKRIEPLNTQPVNMRLFENSVVEWEAHAQQMGSANDAIMGKSPTAGTPFKLQELVTSESHSLHDYRKGKIATFVGEIYTDWIISYCSKEIVNGQDFISSLELDELQAVADSLVTCEANKFIKEKILNGEEIQDGQVEQFKVQVRESFMKGGSKRFISILKDEFKDAPIDIEVNVAGKQKNLSEMTDKLVNVFRQIVSSVNPQTGQSVLDDPRMAGLFNQILEASGLSPIDFYQKPKPPPLPIQPPPNQPVAQPVTA